MKHLFLPLILLIYVLQSPQTVIAFQNHKPVEPALNEKIGWNLKGNGLLYISYDLDLNGRVVYHTVHFVIKSYLTGESLASIPNYYSGAPVFYVNYGPANQIYVISRKALFYAFDVNEDGNWDVMHKDVDKDGINGNETFYDSPSNMFPAGPDRVAEQRHPPALPPARPGRPALPEKKSLFFKGLSVQIGKSTVNLSFIECPCRITGHPPSIFLWWMTKKSSANWRKRI